MTTGSDGGAVGLEFADRVARGTGEERWPVVEALFSMRGRVRERGELLG